MKSAKSLAGKSSRVDLGVTKSPIKEPQRPSTKVQAPLLDAEINRFPFRLIPQLRMMVKPHTQIQLSLRCLLSILVPKGNVETLTWNALQQLLQGINLQKLLLSYKNVKFNVEDLAQTQKIYAMYQSTPKDLLSIEFSQMCESLISICRLLMGYIREKNGVSELVPSDVDEEQPFHLKVQMECLHESKIVTPARESTKFDSAKKSVTSFAKKVFQTPDKRKTPSQRSLLHLNKSPQSAKVDYKSIERRSHDRPRPKQSVNHSFSKTNKIMHMKSKKPIANHSRMLEEPSLESELEYERRLLNDINLKLEKYQQY